jgi:Flp pilus assembly protein TadD
VVVATKADDFRICPKCDARNKAKWEFCVRCGESLQNVTIAASAARAPATVVLESGRSEAPVGAAIVSLVLLVGVLGGSVWWWTHSSAPPPLKTTATVVEPAQSELPAPATPGSKPGDRNAALGRAKLVDNDLPGALPLLAEAVEAAPDNASFQALYAHALLLSGDLAKALEHYTVASQLEPQNAGYRTGLAGALNMAGRFDDAASEYQKILAQQPGDPEVEEDYGELLLTRKHDPAAALSYLKNASAGKPDDPIFAQQLALALEQTHDVDGAAKVYQTVLEKSPDAAEARGRLAEILFTKGKPDDAISLAQAGIKLNPSTPILHRDLGSFLERAGRFPEASIAYREYARLAPNAADARAMTERAEALAQRGNGGSP